MIDYKTKKFSSVDGIKDFLDKNAKTVFFSYGWFKTVELSNFNLKPLYIGVCSNNELVSVAPCFIQYEEPFDTSDKILFGKLTSIADRIFKFKPNLVCYSPINQAVNPVLGEKNHEVLSVIISQMKELCKQNSIKCYCFPYVSDPKIINMLEGLGLNKCYLFDENILHLKKTFEDYQSSLSKNMRNNIRREIKKIGALGIKIEITNRIGAYSKQIAGLYALTYRKYSNNKCIPDETFFKNLDSCLKGRLTLFIAKAAKEVIAFSLVLKDRNLAYAFKTGYRPGYEGIYFNIFYNLPVKHLIKEKFRYAHFGPTLSDLKKRRGCGQFPVYAFFGFNNPFLGGLMKTYIAFLNKKKQIFKPGL